MKNHVNRRDWLSAYALAGHNVGAGGVNELGMAEITTGKRDYQQQVRERRIVGDREGELNMLHVLKEIRDE